MIAEMPDVPPCIDWGYACTPSNPKQV